MRRGIYVLNVFLFILLAALLALDGWDFLERRAYALGLGKTIPTRSVRLMRTGENGFLIRFPEYMVEKEKLGKALKECPFELIPPRELTAWWEEPDLLRVTPTRLLDRALRYRLRLARPLVSPGGRVVEPGLEIPFETPSVRLLGAMVCSQEEMDAHPRKGWALLTFDLPLSAEDLGKHLRASAPGGRPLETRVRSRKDSKGKVFLVEISGEKESKKGPPLAKARVRILPGLLPRGGEVPLGREISVVLKFRENLVFQGMKAQKGGISLRFNRWCPLPEKKWIRLEPHVPFQVYRDWRGLNLAGDFRPGKVYRVTLKKGFPGHGPGRLRTEITQALMVPDMAPSLEFASRGVVLSSKALPELTLRSVNLASCLLEIRTLYPNNVVFFAGRGRWDFPDRAFGPWKRVTCVLGGPRNEKAVHRVSLEGLLGGERVGIHQVRIRPLDEAGRPRGRWKERILQITDLGITARVAEGGVLARVTSLASGRGLEGAGVRVFSAANQLLGEARTGPNGVALVSCPLTSPDRTPFVVEAVLGRDRSFLDLDRYEMEVQGDDGGERPYLSSGVEAYVFMDRGIVRPGGTARAAVLVRDQACLAAAGRALTARWFDPSGRVRREENLLVPGSGLLALEKKFSLSDATGVWRLSIFQEKKLVGTAPVRVEAFVPDRLEVETRPEGLFLLGKEGTVLVKARWLEGSPADKRPGRLLARFDVGAPRFEGYEAFSFLPEGELVPPGGREPVPFVLDEKGRARIRLDLPPVKRGIQVLTARITAEVEDPSGRRVRGGFTETAFPEEGILGIRADEKGATLVLVDGKGYLVEASPVVRVVHLVRRWSWGIRSLESGGFTFGVSLETKEVEEKKVRLKKGVGRVLFDGLTRESGGWHVLSARLGSALAEQAVGDVPKKPDRLRVTCLDAPVKPGGTAHFALDAPFGGDVLLSLEGAGLRAHQVFHVQAGRTILPVPVPRGLKLPNLHALAVLTRPQNAPGAKPPFLMVGGASFALDRPEVKTRVTLDLPSKVRPRSEVILHVRAPGATRALAALVDEGVLRITGHPSPDPLGWFLAPRWNDAGGADTRVRLYDSPRFEAPPIRGGGGRGGHSLGPRLAGSISPFIQPLALSSGILELDGKGEGTFRFRLPPYEGKLRVMVLASGPGVVGAASKELVVTCPLGLSAAGPRMISPGDLSGVVLTVANRTKRPGKAELLLEPFGGARLPAAMAPRRVLLLGPGEHRDVYVPLLAGPEPGRQGLRVTARMGKESRRAEGAFLVRPPALYAELRRGFAFQKKGIIRIPGKWSPRGLLVRLRVGAGLDEALLPLLGKMVQYPYGCVEQTASRGFALLAAGRLLPRLSAEGPPPDFSGMVVAAVDRILSMQTTSGGLAFWPWMNKEYRFGTVYGLDFLLSAKKMGFDVPGETLAVLEDRAARYLGGGSLFLQCYAAQVLAGTGRPVGPWLTLLAERVKASKDREALVRVALGLAKVGRKKEARRLLSLLEGMPPWKKREEWGELHSSLRVLALELRAELRVQPASSRTVDLATRLERDVLNPEGLTTQETAQALLSLAAFDRVTSPAESRPFSCRLSWPGGERILDRPGWVVLPVEGGAAIRVEAKGRVYGFLEVHGFRLDGSETRVKGAVLTRRFLDPSTGKEVEFFRKGRIYKVRLQGSLPWAARNFCFTDVLPGGLELEGKPSKVRLREVSGTGVRSLALDGVEFRDDRILAFGRGPLEGSFVLEYRVRALFPGAYLAPPAQVECLYDPGRLVRGGGKKRVEVLP